MPRNYDITDVKNDRMYLYYYYHWLDLSVTRFTYLNMPEEVNTRCLELMLNSRGVVCFFKDPQYGYLALPCVVQGQFDLYFEPRTVRVYSAGSPEEGISGYTRLVQVYGDDPIRGEDIDKEAERKNIVSIAKGNTVYNNDPDNGEIPRGVLIWNNYLHQTTVPIIQMFAERMANIQRTIDVNISAQKTPYFIKCSYNDKQTLERMFEQVQRNKPAIFGDKDADNVMERIKVLDLNAPQIFRDLQSQFEDVEAELAKYLGIPTQGIEKPERLLVDEVSAAQAGANSSMFSPLGMREIACRKINKLFGLDIEVTTGLRQLREQQIEDNREMMSPLDSDATDDIDIIDEKGEDDG